MMMNKSSKYEDNVDKSKKGRNKGNKGLYKVPQCVELTHAPGKGKGVMGAEKKQSNVFTRKAGRRKMSQRKKRILHEQGNHNHAENEFEEIGFGTGEEDANDNGEEVVQAVEGLRYLKTPSRKKKRSYKTKS